MDMQTSFNIAVGLVAFLGGWVLNNLKASIDNLQKADADLTVKVQSIEVLVAGQYVKRDDLDKTVSALFAKLDKIEAKIDGKADK
jgi:peptidoglycan hydrolase CwlO-like protein